MKTMCLLAFAISLFLAGCADDPSARCSSACDKIFKECGLSSFDYQGRTSTGQDCVDMCQSILEKKPSLAEQGLQCVESASCSQISSCEE